MQKGLLYGSDYWFFKIFLCIIHIPECPWRHVFMATFQILSIKTVKLAVSICFIDFIPKSLLPFHWALCVTLSPIIHVWLPKSLSSDGCFYCELVVYWYKFEKQETCNTPHNPQSLHRIHCTSNQRQSTIILSIMTFEDDLTEKENKIKSFCLTGKGF